MIQRIQSLLLLTAVICSVLMFLIPAFYLHPAGGLQGEIYKTTLLKTYILQADTEKELLKHWPLLMANCLLIVLYLAAIFDYRNRIRQSKICNLTLFLQVGLAIILIYEWKQLTAVAGLNYQFSPGWGIALMSLSMMLVLIARRFILKDEALVRSADRLR